MTAESEENWLSKHYESLSDKADLDGEIRYARFRLAKYIAEDDSPIPKREFFDIAETIRKLIKTQKDIEFRENLFKLAIGYDYEESEIIEEKDGRKRIKKTIKHVPGNTHAMILWLAIKRPDEYNIGSEILNRFIPRHIESMPN